MADEFDQYKVANQPHPTEDEFAQYKAPNPSGPTPLQQSMRQHFQAAENYDQFLRSKQPTMVPRPPMHTNPIQAYQDVSDQMHAQGKIMPQDLVLGPLRDAATLTRAGYQTIAGGKAPTAENPQGKSGLLGTPPPESQELQSGANIGTMMLAGSVAGEGTPPTPRLNRAINSVPTSDPNFGLVLSALKGPAGIKAYLAKQAIKSFMSGTETPSVPRGTLPPEAPEILRQGWAMQQGGRPASPAETGEALSTVRQNSSPVPSSALATARTPAATPASASGEALATAPVPSVNPGAPLPMNPAEALRSLQAKAFSAAQSGEALGSINVPRGTPQTRVYAPRNPVWQSVKSPGTEIRVEGSTAEDIQAQQQRMAARPKPQGGHAGGGVSSVEELNRQGQNFLLDKNGKITAHGKSFAPEETPPGGAHVTLMDDGSYRLNEGVQLNPAQQASLQGAAKGLGIQNLRPATDVTQVPLPQAKPVQPPFPGPKVYNVTRGTDPFTHPNAPKSWRFDQDYSTNVKQYGYDPDSSTLSVMYKKGSVYHFKATPQMYAEMQKAPSAGGYLHDVVEPAQTGGVGRHVGTIELKNTPGARVRQALGGR